MKNWKIGIIVFSILFGGFFIFPSYKEGKNLKQENENLQKKLNEKIKELKALDTEHMNIATTDANLFRKIPQNEMQESIIRTIGQILGRYNFKLEGGVSFSKGFNADVNAPEMKTNFSVVGPKENLEKLVAEFENNERFFGVEKLSVQISLENGKQIVSLPISLSSFFQEK